MTDIKRDEIQRKRGELGRDGVVGPSLLIAAQRRLRANRPGAVQNSPSLFGLRAVQARRPRCGRRRRPLPCSRNNRKPVPSGRPNTGRLKHLHASVGKVYDACQLRLNLRRATCSGSNAWPASCDLRVNQQLTRQEPSLCMALRKHPG
jgi:hypothetical protein